MDSQSTFGMPPKRLAGLLRAGVGPGAADETKDADQVVAELVQGWLTERLPVAATDNPETRSPEDIEAAGEKPAATVGLLLLNRESDLAAVKQVKVKAKSQAAHMESGPEQAAATAIYYAAIASGLLFHDRKITQHSYGDLRESFEMLAGKPWVSTELARHFTEAAELCADRSESSPERTKR